MEALPIRIDGIKVYGGFWRRLLAGVLDSLVLLPLMLLFPLLRITGHGWAFLTAVPAALAFVLFNVWFNARFGGTPGKLAVRLRITRPDGSRIGWREAWMRSSVDLVFAILFALAELWLLMQPDAWPYLRPEMVDIEGSHLTAFFQWVFILQQIWIWSELFVLLLNRRRRAIHDLIAGTVVVKRRFAATATVPGRPIWMTAGVVATGIAGIIAFFSMAGQDIPPPDLSDLEPERLVIAPDENGYTYLIAATNSLHWQIGEEQAWIFFDESPEDRTSIHDLLDRNSEAFALIQKAIDCGRYQAPEIRDFNALLPHIQPSLTMAKLLALKSKLAIEERRYDDAAGCCIMLLQFGTLLQTRPESLISYLVGGAALDIGTGVAGRLVREADAPDDVLVRIGEALAALPPMGPGFAQAIRAEFVMATLLFDQYRSRLRLGHLNDIFITDASMRGFESIPVPRYFFHPNATLLMFADGYRGLIAHASSTYADMSRDEARHASQLTIASDSFLVQPNFMGRAINQVLFMSGDATTARRCLIETRLAAVQLIGSINRFERRTGNYPETLDALVPEYLEAVPRDPFDGQPFRYNPARGVVYSVGKNLEDGGGQADDPDVFSAKAGSRWQEAEDLIFYVREKKPEADGLEDN